VPAPVSAALTTVDRSSSTAIKAPPRVHDAAVQYYLGHKNIEHTVRRTELSPERFKLFWEH